MDDNGVVVTDQVATWQQFRMSAAYIQQTLFQVISLCTTFSARCCWFYKLA